MNDETCTICGCDMDGNQVYDDTCDECAVREGLLDGDEEE